MRLDTSGARIEWLKPDWRMKLLAVITNPGDRLRAAADRHLGPAFEGYHPGGVLPGVVGVISLLVALFAFQLLPTNFAGLALLIIGAGMMARSSSSRPMGRSASAASSPSSSAH